jgi:hypothetical protein
VRGTISEQAKPGLLLALALVLLLNGCATSRAVPVGRLQSIAPPLTTIALAPNGGVFANLIGTELAAQGYTIVETGATLALLVFTHMPQHDILDADVMAMLKARGIDAVLIVQKVDGTDGLPQTVHMRLHSTATMAEVGGVDWQNSWFRHGVLESAQEIAAAMSRDARASDAVDSDQPRAAASNGSEP